MERNVLQATGRKALRVLIRIAVVLLALGCALLLWIGYLNLPPRNPFPTPVVLPNNASDDYLRASRAMKRMDDLDAIYEDWRKMWGRTGRSNDNERLLAQDPTFIGEREYSAQYVGAFLKENHSGLAAIRQGVLHPCVFPMKPKEDAEQYWKRYNEWNIAINRCRQLVEIDALYKLATARPAVAADALVTHLSFAVSLGDLRYLHLHKSRDFLAVIGNKLPVKDLHPVLSRLEQMQQSRPSYADIAERDHQLIVYELYLYLSGKDEYGYHTNRWKMGFSRIHPSPIEDRSTLVNQWYAWTVSNSQVPRIADRYLAECIRVSRHPYCAHIAYPKPPPDIINFTWFGHNEREKDHLQWLLDEFNQDCLILSLALRGYRLEHKAYPARLEELVTSGWVHQLPKDHFTARDTLRYINQGDHFTLYSRGPNGDDDGGKPVSYPAYITTITPSGRAVSRLVKSYIVGSRSPGDVVYGLNEQAEPNSNAGRL